MEFEASRFCDISQESAGFFVSRTEALALLDGGITMRKTRSGLTVLVAYVGLLWAGLALVCGSCPQSAMAGILFLETFDTDTRNGRRPHNKAIQRTGLTALLCGRRLRGRRRSASKSGLHCGLVTTEKGGSDENFASYHAILFSIFSSPVGSN